ncbi:MAG: hypothetical protein K6F41_07055 [Lachnospira sp.]|nr:hypothetical protein [Lachnospira sp.]
MIKKFKSAMKRIFKSKANLLAVGVTMLVLLVALGATYAVPYAVEKALYRKENLATNEVLDKTYQEKEAKHLEGLERLDRNTSRGSNRRKIIDLKKCQEESQKANAQSSTTSANAFFCDYETSNNEIITNVDENEALANGYQPIRTVKELVEASSHTDGKYILLADLDMSEVDWQPWDFAGTFEGNGHVIYNLKVTSLSSTTTVTYDGNYKTYDTYSAGFFGKLSGSVSNLGLIGANVTIKSENHAMLGILAGITENAKIDNCEIYGYVELETSAVMNGVGGLVGYGNGSANNCRINVTLVSVDTDKEVKDENFLGGVLSAGYLDIDNCTVIIDGYDSDHGYVHSGGLVGMYILYPRTTVYEGSITGNSITGTITFFEDNTDRRAYCKGLIGEVMNWTFAAATNYYQDFVRNEIFEYDTNLYPEGDRSTAVKTEEIIEPSPISVGYTKVTYTSTGYSFNTDYTLYEVNVDEWEVLVEATSEHSGIKKGVDTVNQRNVYIDYDYEEEVLAEDSSLSNEENASTITEAVKSHADFILPIVAVIVVIILLVLRFTVFSKKTKKK